MCNNFLQNIAKTCCRHKASPVNRFHDSANNYISDQFDLIKNGDVNQDVGRGIAGGVDKQFKFLPVCNKCRRL